MGKREAVEGNSTADRNQTRARVTVYPRPEILDPQGKAIETALGRLGFDGVGEVRAGKSFEISVAEADPAKARAHLEDMARKLLANPIVEDFTVELLEGDAT